MSQPKRSKLELRGLLIGIVLGDGSLSSASSKNNSRLSIGHSTKQKDYCEHKLKLVAELLRTDYSCKEYSVFNKKTKKYYPIIQGSTCVHRYLTKLRKLLYNKQGIKGLTEKTLKYLTPEGLAYWYMDDGGIIAPASKERIEGLFLSTKNFSYEDHLKIKEYLKNIYNIHCSVVSHGKGRYRIKINKTNAKLFLDIIDKYKHPNLAYKFCLDYIQYRTEFNKINNQNSV